VFNPGTRTDQLISVFVQDEIAIVPDRAALTLGTKLEHNRYTGAEFQPSVRLAWFANDRNTLWMAVTRAVRTPSRLDRDIEATLPLDPTRPIFLRAIGNAGFETERLYAFEAGYRIQPTERLLIDLAAFHNRYPNLFSAERGASFVEANGRLIVPFFFRNLLIGRTTGAELTADARVNDRWSLKGSYSYLDVNLRVNAKSTDTSAATGSTTPRHMVHLLSTLNLADSLEAQGRFRWIDELPSQKIPSYTALDARLAWRATPSLQLAVTGQNLLDPHHGEFGATSLGFTEVRRSVFGELTWRW
jgi:iron complex outermembrane receptor protein